MLPLIFFINQAIISIMIVYYQFFIYLHKLINQSFLVSTSSYIMSIKGDNYNFLFIIYNFLKLFLTFFLKILDFFLNLKLSKI